MMLTPQCDAVLPLAGGDIECAKRETSHGGLHFTLVGAQWEDAPPDFVDWAPRPYGPPLLEAFWDDAGNLYDCGLATYLAAVREARGDDVSGVKLFRVTFNVSSTIS